MPIHRLDEHQESDHLLLEEYEHFLFDKAEGTIEAYLRTVRHIMKWVAAHPGNRGRFRPHQLIRTAVVLYLASLEQEGYSINHRAHAKSTISRFVCYLPDGGKGTAPAEPDMRKRSPCTASIGSL